ncbi:uncharacterized protein LOC8284476 isoform X1 [Ricinus communis]|uniref:uncharacterized protein LOC8284476 isoform X1 n=1 Tax=Ricinus communis TaxID=3988 RepID=UPI00201B2839|nr:uncharacterized protein LOC8284476 isoform X1 [Ricinus communis]XP_048228442.1 uncharacterized protein LOC8284476 isoform X1 [Ricinus communis]XP_048228443.1 uncharacterized protein LOC8284476 isoform X1 [Ricinus communis]
MNSFRRQSPGQVNQDQESIYTGFTTAVAAAAFAIHSLEEAEALKNNKDGNKKGDSIAKLSHSSEVTNRFSFKKTNNGGEILMRQSTIQNHEASERISSARKPINSLSDKLKAPEGAQKKVDRDDKLKTLLAWANVKKMKNQHSNQSKEVEYKFHFKILLFFNFLNASS